MRDRLKNVKYFEEFVETKLELIRNNEKTLESGVLAEKKIERVRYRNLNFRLELLIAKYSAGFPLTNLRKALLEIVEEVYEHWAPINTKVKARIGTETKLLDQYMVEPYGKMLSILSLAFLLDVDSESFEKLEVVIDRDNISDVLYEYIIKARHPDRVPKRKEEYSKSKSVVLKVYGNLREAIDRTDRSEAESLVREFLERDFYHKHSGFYDFHESKLSLYYGYWSFESAAVVAIKDLDDRSFRANPYYPKDLVDYYRGNSKF